MMEAVVLHSPGDPGVLRTMRVPVPRPADGEVLVRVHAVAVSSPDLSIRAGAVPAPLPLLLGSDASGEVVLVGPGVTDWSPSDRVVAVGDTLGRTRSGGYADYLTVSANELHSIPGNVSFLSCASISGTFSTAWSALFRDGRLGMNEEVVIIGAAHPMGIAAVQICGWKGSKVIAVSNGRHARRLGALGAIRVISDSAPDLADRVAAVLDGQGASVVLDLTGSTLPASVQMLNRHGRIVLTGGGDPQLLDVHLLVDRQARVVGASNRIESVDVHHILKLLSEGTFLPVIDSVYPLSKASEAHNRAESNQSFGAVLLVPDRLYGSREEISQLFEEG